MRTAIIGGLTAIVFLVVSIGCAAGGGAYASDGSASSLRSEAASDGRAASRSDYLDQARAILRHVPLIDGHNDTPWQYRQRVNNHLDKIDLASDTSGLEPPMHTDIPRLREGGVGAQIWSVYIPVDEAGGRPGDVRRVMEQIDVVHRLCERYDALELARTADDVERIHEQGKIASLIGMEGGHSIENSLGALRMTYEAGARYMTLAHSNTIPWVDSATDDPEHGGLSPFGEEVVREMNRLGMVVDLSHVTADAMRDALRVSQAPVIFSHSSCRSLCDSPRNAPDDVLSRLRANGGVIMVTFVPSYVSEENRRWYEQFSDRREYLREQFPNDDQTLERELDRWREQNPRPEATLDDVADHIDHAVRVAGIDHVGIGGDFDGVSSLPVGLADVSKDPALLAELLRRGYTEREVEKIAGLNVLRVMREAERVAARLRQTRPASNVRLEEVQSVNEPAD